MKRSGFKRPVYERKPPSPPVPITRGRPAVITGEVVSAQKEEPVRSEEYRRLVAALPCILCGSVGSSQAAHPNTGKGAGIKADDRLCFPLCADTIGRVGCHTRFDQGAIFTKDERRDQETVWGLQTQAQIRADGDWPKGLPAL